MKKRITYFIALFLLLSACGYSPKSAAEANNTKAPIDIVKTYLRALESGEWTKAESLLSNNYRLRSTGDNWIKGGRKSKVLASYQAWRKAFPRFQFKEELLERTGNGVRLGIYYTGNHQDTLSLGRSGLELIDSTGITMRLPVEYHTYYVENDLIVFTRCEIPLGAGREAIIQQLTK
ncbi:MAG: hypothetical protein KDC34_06890 [Saprospiraceae bacterium]|nr:hypothetical protein [Saprospiraceae bacterium]